MATSAVEICNSALIKIGAEKINALSDNNARALIMNEQYDKKRRYLLTVHPWNFAIGRAELAENATAPINGWDNAYDMTSDVLRVLEINDDDEQEWVVEGRQILTDESECKIKYIKDLTDVTKFSNHFVEVLATLLAADTCMALKGNATHAANLYNVYLRMLSEARTMDAQEGSNLLVKADLFTNARF